MDSGLAVPLSVQIFDQMRHHGSWASIASAAARDSLNFFYDIHVGDQRGFGKFDVLEIASQPASLAARNMSESIYEIRYER